MDIWNVYLDPASQLERISQIQRIARLLSRYLQGASISRPPFIYKLNGECNINQLETDAWNEVTSPHFINEWFQPAATHQSGVTTSRLDMVYANMHKSDQLQLFLHVDVCPGSLASLLTVLLFSVAVLSLVLPITLPFTRHR